MSEQRMELHSDKPMTGAMRADGAPLSLDEYRRMGGYEVLRSAVTTMAPNDVIKVVEASGLLGRGGAGFSTGRKWSFTPPASKYSKYVVCNADEMEPGSFKDRILMEGNPHLLIEGIAIAAYATGSTIAYNFIRGEYARSANVFQAAVDEAYGAGLLGERIFGSEFSLDMYTHRSAGRYLCGEASAMLSALEGRRAVPRFRPPHMTSAGLWARPTIVNNVESLCCVPSIVGNGAEWWLSLGRAKEGGTKMYTVAGKVKHPGAWELPIGTPMREVIEMAGGMQDGYQIKGVIPGGASSAIVHPRHLDVAMDFASMKKIGSSLGTGTLVVIDDRISIVSMLVNLLAFFAQESCGWCTPCWAGTHWMLRLLQRIEAGDGTAGDIELIQHLSWVLSEEHCFCDHGPSATRSTDAVLRDYREEVEAKLVPMAAGDSLVGDLSPAAFTEWVQARRVGPLAGPEPPDPARGLESNAAPAGAGPVAEPSEGTAAQ